MASCPKRMHAAQKKKKVIVLMMEFNTTKFSKPCVFVILEESRNKG